MRTSKRLKPVVGVAQLAERRAAGKFAGEQQTLGEYQLKLNALLSAREEYLENLQNQQAPGMSAHHLGSMRNFISRLDTAIAELTNQCSLQRARCDEERRAWLTARTRVKALDGVVENHDRNEKRVVISREQGELDDLAGASHHLRAGP